MSDCQDLYTWVDGPGYEWVDESYFEFGECSHYQVGQLNQVWRDDVFAYAVTSSGLDIFDIFSTNKVAYVINEGGFTTIWGNSDFIYLGTYSDGIKFLEKINISSGNLTAYTLDYAYYYNVSSNNVKYLHGFNEVLAVITDKGIDVLNNNLQGFKSTTSGTNFTKCFMTSKKELYYVVQGATNSGICKINNVLCDWEIPDIFYGSGVSFLPDSQGINDIFVTENTSSNGVDNTLFVATDNGAFILDEGVSEFDTYYIKD